MSIRSILHSELPSRFPEIAMAFGGPPGPIAWFPLPPPHTGNGVITHDGLEITVVLGDITHGHFDSYSEDTSVDVREREVCTQVCEFLQDLLQNKVLLWKAKNGMSGGWRYEFSTDDFREDCDYFLWSGPIQPTLSSSQDT